MMSIPVVKFRSYSNATMIALSTSSKIIVCCNDVWPTTHAIGKMYKMPYAVVILFHLYQLICMKLVIVFKF